MRFALKPLPDASLRAAALCTVALRTAARCVATLCAFGWLLVACSGEAPTAHLPEEGRVIEPPFEVQGEAEGLMLVWFDEDGTHTSANRSSIPEAHRERVRVDSLDIPPDQRLDPDRVYVADLRVPGSSGTYTVREMGRDQFDAFVESASAAAQEPVAMAADGEVIIYGASWCNACQGAAAYLRQQNVDFVERDVEREPGAREAMQQAAAAAGVQTRGIPVIDFRGQIIAGFDRGALARAIERSRTPI
ncbi:MAG: glutaredoxin family protein [Sandaracinaceae bacterium]